MSADEILEDADEVYDDDDKVTPNAWFAWLDAKPTTRFLVSIY